MHTKLITCILLTAALAACQPNGSEETTTAPRETTQAADTPVGSATDPAQAAPAPADQLVMAATDSGVAFQEGVATLDGDALASSGSAGFLMYGPYTTLAAGKYVATIEGTVETVGTELIFDVTSQGHTFGQESVAGPKPAGTIATIRFELPQATPGIEVRARAGEGANVRITGYKVVRQ